MIVIGGGVVGRNAIEMAIGLGADVTVLDRDLAVLEQLSARFGVSLRTVYSTQASLRAAIRQADLVIGAVLVRGARAARLVSREELSEMRPGSVLVDVAIDQGGFFETSRPTTHADPTYVVDQVVHYCVANMPGAVPRTSTWPSTTPPSPTRCAWRTVGHLRCCRRTVGWRTASTSTRAWSRNPPSLQRWDMNTWIP